MCKVVVVIWHWKRLEEEGQSPDEYSSFGTKRAYRRECCIEIVDRFICGGMYGCLVWSARPNAMTSYNMCPHGSMVMRSASLGSDSAT